jgi:hypothetical protein
MVPGKCTAPCAFTGTDLVVTTQLFSIEDATLHWSEASRKRFAGNTADGSNRGMSLLASYHVRIDRSVTANPYTPTSATIPGSDVWENAWLHARVAGPMFKGCFRDESSPK